ncbi:MAG: hypothetical protein WC958_05925 [Dehalococcoidales bacterium]
MRAKISPPKRMAFIWLGIALFGVLIFFFPWLIGMDGFDGGFPLSIGGGLVSMTGVIAAVLYFRQASYLDRILKKESRLAHWTYTPEEWKVYTEKEHQEDAAAKRGLFFMIAIIAVIVGLIMAVAIGEDFLIIALIILGIIAVAALAAFFSTLSSYLNNKKHLGEVYIALDGIYFNRQVHIWKGLGNVLEDIAYDKAENESPGIVLTYSAPSKDGRNSYTARIPIPPGQEEAAKKIVAKIAAAHLQTGCNNF